MRIMGASEPQKQPEKSQHHAVPDALCQTAEVVYTLWLLPKVPPSPQGIYMHFY